LNAEIGAQLDQNLGLLQGLILLTGFTPIHVRYKILSRGIAPHDFPSSLQTVLDHLDLEMGSHLCPFILTSCICSGNTSFADSALFQNETFISFFSERVSAASSIQRKRSGLAAQSAFTTPRLCTPFPPGDIAGKIPIHWQPEEQCETEVGFIRLRIIFSC
jgi:hypothetical protein